MNAFFKATALAAATASLATAMPAAASTIYAPAYGADFRAPGEQTYEHSRDRYWDRRGYRDDYRGYRSYSGYRSYGEPVYRDSRAWRGRDGRYYCRRSNGTTSIRENPSAGSGGSSSR